MKECPKCRTCYEDDVSLCPNDQEVPVFTIAGATTISGRYILTARLGQGGMGIVFRSKHKFLKSAHAIKIILPSLVDGDPDLLVRFRQEAILAASIDHPNVIRVTDFGVENDVMPFLVMEYIDGVPLSNYLTEKPLSIKETFDLFIPIAEGVAEAHQKGIVHRDIKPQNIMVQKNLPLHKAIKVLDFGLAKIKSADSYPSLVQAKTMNIVGSPPYMSPEQWSGEGVDHRTDIYALSAILYQMVVGRLPFTADSMPAMMYQHLTVAPPSAASVGVTIAPELEAVIVKGLEKDPDNRYRSMDEMLAALGEALGGSRDPRLTGVATVSMQAPRSSGDVGVRDTLETKAALSDSQKRRLYTYFDSLHRPDAADPQLAKRFLEVQDQIESAKTEAFNADLLVQELAEAQKDAEAAQYKALEAKQRIEADVRRKVEAEMERLRQEDKAKQKAEAERLALEVEARAAAEARANYLAQTALKAQRLAEIERKKREEESQQREVHEEVRRKAELEAQELAREVAEARKEYETAKADAEREAQFRAKAELDQKRVEEELKKVALTEAERRKVVEAEAKKQIEQQAEHFENEAQAARQRLDEARALIDLEAQKREKADAARIEAEKEAERLSEKIVEVQRQMEELQQHITYDTHGRAISSHALAATGSHASQLTLLSGGASSEIPTILTTGDMTPRRSNFAVAAIALVSLLVLGGVGLGVFLLMSPAVADQNTNPGTPGENSGPQAPVARKQVLIPGGTFMMGRDDVGDKRGTWGDQFPAHSVSIDPFSIDVYETTNAQYADFVAATARDKVPAYWIDRKPPDGQANYPVTNVSLTDAKAYAEWISAKEGKTCRVPTENEWEYAARNGSRATSFPWGNDGSELFVNSKLKGYAGPVASMRDTTLVGEISDMLGNASEWTTSVYSLYPGHPGGIDPGKGKYVIRGLNYDTPEEYLKRPELLITFRQGLAENLDKKFIGFRLVCQP